MRYIKAAICDPRRVLVISSLALLVLLALAKLASSAECLPSPAAAKAALPGATYAYWSGRVAGHRGERCWFATGGPHERQVRAKEAPVRQVEPPAVADARPYQTRGVRPGRLAEAAQAEAHVPVNTETTGMAVPVPLITFADRFPEAVQGRDVETMLRFKAAALRIAMGMAH